MKRQIPILLLLCVFTLLIGRTAELGTAISYQGQLLDGGEPANGQYDLRFILYDAATDGTAHAGPVFVPDVQVTNGLFTAEVDFGSDVFSGQASWLEVAVKPSGSTAGHTALDPRQSLTAAPYALFALGGNEGPLGPTGPAGPQGIQGVAGPEGPQGLPGADGVDGAPGVQGPIGPDGPQGPEGQQGAPGTDGADGPTGPQGAAGPMGPIGPTGLQGSEGSTGPQGEPGVDAVSIEWLGSLANPPAVPALNQAYYNTTDDVSYIFDDADAWQILAQDGAVGSEGATGPQGPEGPQGPIGLTGVQGPIGPQGSEGPQGPEGLQGETGPEGPPGSADAWSRTGNAGTIAGVNFLGTTDGQALEIKVNGQRALRLEPDSVSPNLVGGSVGNLAAVGVQGVVIGGGGETGAPNETHGSFTTLSGGYANAILSQSDYSTVAGGSGNTVDLSSQYAAIGGGQQNLINSNSWWSVVGGGEMNQIDTNANWSVVPGGRYNEAGGNLSLAAGYRAKAIHTGAFVWADTTDADFSSSADNQFAVRAAGGVQFETGGSGMSLDGAAVLTTPVQTAALANNSVTSLKITDGTVAAADLADNAITSAKIATGAVTSAKIADGTIQNADIGILSRLTASDGSPVAAVSVDAEGRVGVGTDSPSQVLDVAGDGLVRGPSFATAGDTATLNFGDTNHYIRSVHTSGVRMGTFQAPDAVTIEQGTGNVGVGTTAPEERLHVIGNVKVEQDSPSEVALTTAASGGAYGIWTYTDGAWALQADVDTDNSIGGAILTTYLSESSGTGWFTDVAISAWAKSPRGVRGVAAYAEDTDGADGLDGAGVYGTFMNDNFGTLGSYTNGVYGEQAAGTTAGAAVHGHSSLVNGNGVIGEANEGSVPYGVWGKSSSGYAGFFSGNVHVTGTLTAGTKSFKIDHPLDPENKYLMHSCVESPDMMNVYNGNIVLDGNGEAWVELPDWFEALNRDFCYQLTSVGRPGPNLHVAEEIDGNRFQIAGGQPGMRVSWQVTGIRHDPWANANRTQVEQDKPVEERDHYLSPTLYGKPTERSVQFAHKGRSVRPSYPDPITGKRKLSRGKSPDRID